MKFFIRNDDVWSAVQFGGTKTFYVNHRLNVSYLDEEPSPSSGWEECDASRLTRFIKEKPAILSPDYKKFDKSFFRNVVTIP